jgi:hypothetical protein
MVDKSEINLYMTKYDPWRQGSPWFGNFITPYNWKIDIKHLTSDEIMHRMDSVSRVLDFSDLIDTYGVSTDGEMEYIITEYLKKLKEKVEILKIPFLEERQKQKEEYRRRFKNAPLRESRKDIKKERDDIERAVQDLNRFHNFDVSYEEMVKEIENTSPVELDKEIWRKLENTESNQIEKGGYDKVFDISNKYNKSNPLKLKKKFLDGTYNCPLIVRFDDRYWLVAGNTRLCTAAAMGMTPLVIIADLNKPYPVDESTIIKNLKNT